MELCFQSHNIDLTIKEFLNQNQQVIYDLANLILVFFSEYWHCQWREIWFPAQSKWSKSNQSPEIQSRSNQSDVKQDDHVIKQISERIAPSLGDLLDPINPVLSFCRCSNVSTKYPSPHIKVQWKGLCSMKTNVVVIFLTTILWSWANSVTK